MGLWVRSLSFCISNFVRTLSQASDQEIAFRNRFLDQPAARLFGSLEANPASGRITARSIYEEYDTRPPGV
jgi:hypothetical protein